MSLFTHCIHVFLLPPFLPPPPTSKCLHLETQSSASLRSTCPKPSQPATTNNSIHTFDTQPMPEIFTFSSVLQGHSRHPPNHTILRSHKPLHIKRLRRPSFAFIHKQPLYTCSIYLSLQSQGSPPHGQQHSEVRKLSPSTSYSSS